MIENYKCSCCERWYKKSELHHISYSSDENAFPKQYIFCKECKKAGCIGICKLK